MVKLERGMKMGTKAVSERMCAPMSTRAFQWSVSVSVATKNSNGSNVNSSPTTYIAKSLATIAIP